MKRFLLLFAVLIGCGISYGAEPKRVLVCTVTTGFRHSCIPTAEQTLQNLAETSHEFTIVEWVRQPEIEIPKAPRQPAPLAPDADDAAKAKFAAAQKRFEQQMAKWSPDQEKARQELQGKMDVAVVEALKPLAPANLRAKKIDAVIFACTTGDLPMPDKEGFIKWIEEGHGFVGMHSATDTFHGFPGYLEMIGGEFAGHGAQVPGDLVQGDAKHPATLGLPAQWNIPQDELYEFKNHDRAKVHVLYFLRHRPGYPEETGYAGVSWCKMAGKGKVFYTSLGHREDIWSDAAEMKDHINPPEVARQFQAHILGGIRWSLGLAEGSAAPNPEVR